MFQLIYLDFTAPRLDTAAFQALKNQVGPYLANRGADPDEVFGDTVAVTMSQHNFRARPLTAATFAEVNPEKSLAFYKERFADASGLHVRVRRQRRHADAQAARREVLASLPSTGRKETFRDNGGAPPKGVVERVVHKGVEPKANTIIDFTGACQYSPETRFAMRALVELFQIKLNETLREQLGGAYSPSAGGGCSRLPRQRYTHPGAVQLVAGERREAVEERVRADRFAEDAGAGRGRRRQGEGRADARPRGGPQAERLLAEQSSWRERRRARTSRACSARTTR